MPKDEFEELKEKINRVNGRYVTSLEYPNHPGSEVIEPQEGERNN